MIDLHSHILPGLDDGSRTLETSLGMAQSAVEDGITVIAATPHVRDDYPTEPEEMEQKVVEVAAAIAEAGIPLTVLTGGEVAFEWLPGLDDDALRRFGLGGNPGYLLLELPVVGWPLGLEDTLVELRLRGSRSCSPIRSAAPRCASSRSGSGHWSMPERSFRSQRPRSTAASGRETGRRLSASWSSSLAHMIASDAHAPTVRQIGMSEAAGVIGDPDLARWLTQDVPAAIVGRTALPERPDRPEGPEASWFRRFFRR